MESVSGQKDRKCTESLIAYNKRKTLRQKWTWEREKIKLYI